MKIKRLFLILALGGFFLMSCKDKDKTQIKTETIAFTKEGELQVFKQDSLLTNFDIEIAESEYETQTGLMYRQSMEGRQAMLFIFPDVAMHSFYMKNTEFPLDIIFIDENQKVASMQKNAQPFNEDGLSSQVPVKYVLEINSGLADRLNIAVGDSISFSRN